MISAKQQAIRYKDEYGNMQNAGVLCQFGTFGEDYLQYANGFQFNNLNVFGKEVVELHFKKVTSMASAFQQTVTNETVEHLIINADVSEIANTNACFYSSTKDTKLKRITLNADWSLSKYGASIFLNLTALETIDGKPLNLSNVTTLNSAFGNNNSLVDVRFVEESIFLNISFAYSPLLSYETIQSIINGLAPVETAQTLTVHKDVEARMSDEQKAQITSKNWTLAVA